MATDLKRNPPPEFKSRPRDEDRATRKPMSSWDRSKFLILLGTVWIIGVWALMAKEPGTSFRRAALLNLRLGWLLLVGIELLRQLHYVISEHSSPYHKFWTDKVFAAYNRRTGKVNDWTRFRLSRVFRYVFWLLALDLVLAKTLKLSPALALFQVPILAVKALPLVLQVMFFMFLAISQFLAIFWFLSRGGIETFMPDDIKTRFTDVWGQDHVLEQVKENMLFLEDPESIEEKGGYVPGGILLWGPPGTGKTLMAEAAAGETARPFVFVEPGAFVNMFFGIGSLKVKLLFRKLRKLALRHGGVIAFFDEADVLGNRGAISQGPAGQGAFSPFASLPSCNGFSHMSPHTQTLLLSHQLAGQSTEPRPPKRDGFIMGMGMGRGDPAALQALLAELSGLKKPRGFFNKHIRRLFGLRPKPPPKYRILVMMATNQPSALDEALLRPGRIDRIYRVGYPSKEGRKRTYEGYLDKVKHELTPEQIDKLALMTPYATGASIKDLVNEALVICIRDGRENIVWKDVVKARLLKSLGPPEDVEYIERERHAVAVHEACHAVAAYRVRRHMTIDIATIEKGQSFLGMVASIPPEEQFTQWRTEFESDLVVSLASIAGERIFFDGDNSSGVSGDLHGATAVAMYMEGFWGMGPTLGSHDVVKGGAGYLMVNHNMLESRLGQKVEVMLGNMYKRASDLIEANRHEVLAVAHALETHKTLTGDDVAAVIEGVEGPLVDGRVYSTAEFPEMAETYHAQVVAAHKGHSRPAGALPRLAPVAASPAPGEAVAIEDQKGKTSG